MVKLGKSIVDVVASDFCANILDTAKASDQFAAILLRKRLWFGITAYYFNLRPQNDDVYAGRVGLFAGKPNFNSDNERIEEWQACALRELDEETGLSDDQVSALEPLCDLSGKNSKNATNVGAIFLGNIAKKINAKLIAKNIADKNAEIERDNQVRKAKGEKLKNLIGSLYVIWRYPSGAISSSNWAILTPQASFALISAIDKYDTK